MRARARARARARVMVALEVGLENTPIFFVNCWQTSGTRPPVYLG